MEQVARKGTPTGRIVGRELERGRLATALNQARQGAGGLVLITGEAGIGKTTLLADLITQADAAGFTTLSGACNELDRTRPFHGWLDLLDAVPGARRDLGAELTRPVGHRADGAQTAPAAYPVATARFAVIDRITQMASDLSARQATLVVLDDLHWADEETLQTLASVARAATTIPLLVVAASRPVESTVRAVASLRHQGSEPVLVRVAPLTDAEVVALTQALTGAAPGEQLKAEVVRAGGNPWFVSEMIAEAERSGRLVHRGDTVEQISGPPGHTPTGMSGSPMAHLSQDTQEVVRAAAVLGRSFSVPVLTRLLDQGPVELAAALREAVDGGVLEDTGSELAFRHDLLRDAVYGTMPSPVQRQLHTEAARAMADCGESKLRIAAQIQMGSVGRRQPPDEETLEWMAQAVDEAGPSAPATAAQLLRHILDVLNPGDARRPDFLAQLITNELFSGRLRVAESLARPALDDREFSGEQHAAISYGLAQSLFIQGKLTEAGDLFSRIADDHPGWNTAAVLADVAMAKLFAGELGAAQEAAVTALDVAHQTDDVVGEVAALAVQAAALSAAGDVSRGVELAQAATGRAEASSAREAHRNVPYLFLAQAQLAADQVDEARGALERAGEVSEQLALGWDEPLRLALAADVDYRMGNWDDALANTEAALAHSLDLGAKFFDTPAHALLGRVHLYRGELDLAGEELARAKHIASEYGSGVNHVLWLEAMCAEATGRLTDALQLMGLLWSGLAERDLNGKLLELAPDAARLAARTRPDGGADLGGQVENAVRALAATWPDSSAPAVAARCLGILEGRPDRLVHAAALLRQRRRPVEQAFAEWEAASMLKHQQGQGTQADQLMESARQLLDPLGARPLPVVNNGEARPTHRRTKFGWDALTRTELKVVDLVAAGLSNTEIADQLICSRRTVESHLSHIYSKLGTNSRVAVAVEARERSGSP